MATAAVIVAAAAAALLVAAGCGSPDAGTGADTAGESPGTAGPARPLMITAMSRASTLSCTAEYRYSNDPWGALREGRSTMTADGDLRWTETGTRHAGTATAAPWYLAEGHLGAAEHEAVSVGVPATGTQPSGQTQTNVWIPQQLSYDQSPLTRQGYATIVKAALAEGDPALDVTAVSHRGRPAWQATWNQFGTRVEVVVDRESGLAVSWRYGDGKDDRRAERWSGEAVLDDEVDPDPFVMPADADVRESDLGSSPCSPAEAGRRVGYRPPAPAWLPSGYRRTDTATTWVPTPYAWLNGRAWGPARSGAGMPDNEVDLAFSRGFDWFTVQWAPTGRDLDRNDPSMEDLASRQPFHETVELRAGVLRGVVAHTWFDGAGANLLAYDAEWAVWIRGVLTRDEAVAVAESLVAVR